MTLKYFALASKTRVGAEDFSKNLLIVWATLWTVFKVSFMVYRDAHNTVFYFT